MTQSVYEHDINPGMRGIVFLRCRSYRRRHAFYSRKLQTLIQSGSVQLSADSACGKTDFVVFILKKDLKKEK